MDLRHVEQTIKRRLGGDFTGKIIVRIVDGQITRCDVGSPSAPIPYVGGIESMKDVVNMPEPRPRPPEVIEAEAEAERANVAWQAANDAYFDAQDKLRAAERAASGEGYYPRPANTPNHTYDEFGVPVSADVDAGRRAVQAARAKRDEADKALHAARVRAHQVGQRWERRRRIEDSRAA